MRVFHANTQNNINRDVSEIDDTLRHSIKKQGTGEDYNSKLKSQTFSAPSRNAMRTLEKFMYSEDTLFNVSFVNTVATNFADSSWLMVKARGKQSSDESLVVRHVFDL